VVRSIGEERADPRCLGTVFQALASRGHLVPEDSTRPGRHERREDVGIVVAVPQDEEVTIPDEAREHPCLVGWQAGADQLQRGE
jgi:hypothetical protein